MFREETLFNSAKGARWKISTNQAYPWDSLPDIYTQKLQSPIQLIKLFRLSNTYSLCWASKVFYACAGVSEGLWSSFGEEYPYSFCPFMVTHHLRTPKFLFPCQLLVSSSHSGCTSLVEEVC